jgi:hypothetical protein
VTVHTSAAAGAQNRPARAAVDRPLQSAVYRGWQWDQNYLVALSTHREDSMAVFLAEVVDVRTGGLEDPQSEQPEHRHQGEVI